MAAERVRDRDHHVGQQDRHEADDHRLEGVQHEQRPVDDAGAAQDGVDEALPAEDRDPAIGADDVADHQRHEEEKEQEQPPSRRQRRDHVGCRVAEHEGERRRSSAPVTERAQDDRVVERVLEDRARSSRASARRRRAALCEAPCRLAQNRLASGATKNSEEQRERRPEQRQRRAAAPRLKPRFTTRADPRARRRCRARNSPPRPRRGSSREAAPESFWRKLISGRPPLSMKTCIPAPR